MMDEGPAVDLLETIRTAWSFTGLEPSRVLDTNLFGNVLVEAVDGAVWRIFPEELSCEKIADDRAQFSDLQKTEDFVLDWEMETLVVAAKEKFGALPPGRCYCFKIPGVLGGAYDVENCATIAIEKLLAFTGDVAEQVQDVPDGGTIEFQWIGDDDS